MFKVNCVIEPHYPVKTKFLRISVSKILELLKLKSKSELTVSIVGDRKMRALNKEFALLDETTDVLSFSQTEKVQRNLKFTTPPEDGYLYLGDIVISYPQAIQNAIKDNTLTDVAIQKLLVHGILHLLGYDHQTPAEQLAMMKFEEQILSGLIEN